jgi:hypothetical protein
MFYKLKIKVSSTPIFLTDRHHVSFSADQVPLFLAVLDAGSFSAAARACALGRQRRPLPRCGSRGWTCNCSTAAGASRAQRRRARMLEPQARLLAEQLQLPNWQAPGAACGLEEG